MHYVHRPEVSEEAPEELEISRPEAPVKSAERAPQRIEAFPPRMEAEREPTPEPTAPVTRVHQAPGDARGAANCACRSASGL
jgi:hypothetical protein